MDGVSGKLPALACVRPATHMCVRGRCFGGGGGSDFRLWQALCWSPALRRRRCQVPDRIRERLPMENMSTVLGNKHKLSCVEEKGHCSEGRYYLGPRLTLEGMDVGPAGLTLYYFGTRVETRDQ